MVEQKNNKYSKLLIFLLVAGLCITWVNADWVRGAVNKVLIQDPDNATLFADVESNGALAVNIQDQTSVPVDFFFVQLNAPPIAVASNASYDSRTINVTSVVPCSVGDYFGAFNDDDERDNRAYFGEVQSISGTVLTLDTPLDFGFKTGDPAGCFDRNLNVDGSTTQQNFSVRVGPNATQSIDITRLMFSFTTDSAVSLDTFGDLASLTNGLVLRRIDGSTHNIWNIKNNGELANICFDYDPQQATNPIQGQDGAKFRCTFAGQEKHGVTIRLDPGDELQAIIQDDLTGLNQFRIIAEGHYVTD